MNPQVVKHQANQVQKSQVPNSTRLLLNSVIKGNLSGILENTRKYMTAGVVSFDKVLAISLHSRVPNLTHVYGFERVHEIVIVLLTSFNNALNLIRPMSSDQIIECAHDLVMTTEEDQLSIEDYVLFFKGAKEGKYGKILDRLDQQTVFSMLEEYRQERHRQYLRIREEKEAALKSQGSTERTNNPDPIAESMVQLGGRLSRMKEQLKEQREINRMQKFEKGI